MTYELPDTDTTAIILAAGQGTRMRSSIPKVLHPIAGKPMLHYVLETVNSINARKTIVVTGPDSTPVEASCAAIAANLAFVVQEERLGTGDAVKRAESHIKEAQEKDPDGITLILYGDTPFIQHDTLSEIILSATSPGTAITVLGFEAANPTGYGRLLQEADGTLQAIIEEKDANEAERAIHLCNSGVMAVRNAHLLPLLSELTNNNAKKEYYLTDIVSHARAQNLRVDTVIAAESEVLGVNNRAQLAAAEAVMQTRLREQAFTAGATLLSPETTFLHHDTALSQDVVIHPHVVFGPGVTIGANTEIRSFSHIEGATIAENVIIGPFARLRPGTTLAPEVHIGNFVELKKADIAAGAKINHLSYVGDASVGKNTNIGAGVITCNYDGYTKSQTTIADDVFVGSNANLIAPLTIGQGAIIGAGSTIRKDVPKDALAITEQQQENKEKRAAEYRKEKLAKSDA